MPTHQPEAGARTQVRYKVAEIEQRGGSPTAQSSANRIGPTGWFRTATNRKGKASGESDARANNDATMGYSAPTTGSPSQITRDGSVKSGHSGKCQSFDEHKSSREKAQLSLDLSTAKREEAAAKILIMSIDSQLSPSRGRSRGTSEASSIASSHRSRQVKHDESNRSLHGQL
jgi:hypothetical protein